MSSPDQYFEDLLQKIRPYALGLPTNDESSRLCKIWLGKLKQSSDQPNLRNDYLAELYKQLKSGNLGWPFDHVPESGKLMPISRVARLPTSSSCNELTETSLSMCEKKRSWSKPRSKSLRRDINRRQQPRHFDIHSNNSNRMDNSITASSPTVHFCEQDNRFDRNLLKTYKERIETLSTIAVEFENQNEKLQNKLIFYQNEADNIPHLHARIQQFMMEIASLKSKLQEVDEIKNMLNRNHKAIVDKYKYKMKEQYEKLLSQIDDERKKNKELQFKITEFEQKFNELGQEKEESVRLSERDWLQKIENLRNEYEEKLRGKDLEIRKRDEIFNKKQNELTEKINEIEVLSERIKKQQQILDSKSKDDGKLHTILIDQYEKIRDELSKMSQSIEMASWKPNDIHDQEIMDLKKSVQKLERMTQNLQQEYEKKITNIVKEKDKTIRKLQNQKKNFSSLTTSDKEFEIDSDTFESRYKDLLNFVEAKAENKRHKYYKKLTFLEDQWLRLKKR